MIPPGLTQLSERVFRLRAANPSFFTGPGTNTYLIRDACGAVAVVDPGPEGEEHIRLTAEAARGLGRPEWVLLTHAHPDHAQAVAPLMGMTGARLAAWGSPNQLFPVEDLPPADRVLGDGDELLLGETRVEALFTPGHASDHLCFWLPQERRLFTGDMIISTSRVVVLPPDGSLPAYMQSLARLEGLAQGVSLLSPGHGEDLQDPAAAFALVRSKREAREQEIANAVSKTPRSAAELAMALYGPLMGLDPWMHIVTERHVLAHLLKLEGEGIVRREGEEGWSLS